MRAALVLRDNVRMRRVVASLCAVAVVGVVALLLVWTRAPRLSARTRPGGQFGQGSTGRPIGSPHEATEGTVDGAVLSIEYGRPSMRGRTIFGGLVPYDRVWCPGADACTKLTNDHDLRFGTFTLRAGAYTLWMRPSETKWTLTFNSQANAFHVRRNPTLDVGTIDLQKTGLSTPVEQLTFTIEPNPGGSGGVIAMGWEKTRVVAPFVVLR